MSLKISLRFLCTGGAAALLTACPNGKDAPGAAKGGPMPPVPVNIAAAVKKDMERARALAASSAATVTADEALSLIAETQLGYTTIEAPMDGRTGSIRLRPGNLIKAGDDLPLTTLVQISPIYVNFALPEK